jgi:hypothetical protein
VRIHPWSGVKMKIRKAHECIGPPTFAKDAKVGHPPNYPTQAKTGLGWGTLPRYRMTTSWQLSLLLVALGTRWMISRPLSSPANYNVSGFSDD